MTEQETRQRALGLLVEHQEMLGLFGDDGKPTRDMAMLEAAGLQVLVNLTGRGVTVRGEMDGGMMREQFTWKEVEKAVERARHVEYARQAHAEFLGKGSGA